MRRNPSALKPLNSSRPSHCDIVDHARNLVPRIGIPGLAIALALLRLRTLPLGMITVIIITTTDIVHAVSIIVADINFKLVAQVAQASRSLRVIPLHLQLPGFKRRLVVRGI